MAAVPTPIESGDVFLDQITKEDVREYFLKMDCSLRVLGSQFGLEPSKLSDLEHQAALGPMNLRLLLLDECFKQEKIKSWLQFVTVLEKPALDQRTIAGEIRRRFNSVSRQISMDSATSSVSINTATTPMSPLSSMEVSGSFSSSLGIKTGSIEIHDAVNEIMNVSYQNLHKLGGCLGLDENKIQNLLTQYRPEEKHQRLIELWFQRSEPTWEQLNQALSSVGVLGESLTSMDADPAIPRPSSTELLMLQSNMEEIKSRFSDLLLSVRYALEENNVQIDDLRQILTDILDLGIDNFIPRSNLAEIFTALSDHKLWDYKHHSPVEKLVNRCLRGKIISEVKEYKKQLSGFYVATKLIHFTQISDFDDDTEMEASEISLRSYGPKDYKLLRVKLKLKDRRISELSLKYVQELWESLADEFELPSLTALLDKVLEGCLEVSWLIPPREAQQIATLAPRSTPFFLHLDVIYVSLNGNIIYSVNQELMEDVQATIIPEEERGKLLEKQFSVSDSIVPQRLGRMLQHQHSSGDIESVIGDFEGHFSKLLVKCKTELLQSKKQPDKVYMLLKTLSGKDFQRYIRDVCHTTPTDFDDLFDHLNSYRWNCFEYELLEAIIKRNKCSSALQKGMEQHAQEIKKFKQHTPISKVCKHRHSVFKRKSRLKGYKKLTTKFTADPYNTMLETLDPFPEKVRSDLKFPLHLNNMEIGSIPVDWSFHEEHEYTLMTYLCSEEGGDLLEQCEISEVLIDDIPLDQSLLLLTAAAREDWERVDALLQDKSENIDLNYTNANLKDGQTALFHVAVKGQGCVDLVEKMVQQGANPNIQDAGGWSPLMRAVGIGNKEMVEALLKVQCDIEIREDTQGWSALHIAAHEEKLEIMEVITKYASEYGIDIMSLRDKEDKTVLQIAEEKQHGDMVRLLTELMCSESEIELQAQKGDEDSSIVQRAEEMDLKDPDPEMHQDEESSKQEPRSSRIGKRRRNNKLNKAAIRGSVPDVQKALSSGANINNYAILTQRTPLMEASERNHTEVVKLLLSKGADPKKTTINNRTALSLASRRGHVETVEVLLSAGLPHDILNKTAGFWKWTILHSICFQRGHEKPFTKEEFCKRMERIVELLVTHGVDPFIQDRTGDTALTFACFRGYLAFVKIIVENIPAEHQKKLINHQRNDDWSALLLASRHGHTEVVRYLLEKDASMTVSNKYKMTALHLGVSGRHVETVEELAKNADPAALNAIDSHGYTPLFIATKLKNIKLVEVLAKAGADPTIVAKKEKLTAQRYAAKLNLVAIQNVLSQKQYLTSEQIQKHAVVVAGQEHPKQREEELQAEHETKA